MTVKEAAAKLKVSDDAIRSGIRQGKLPGVVIGVGDRAQFIIPDEGFDLFLKTGVSPAHLAQKILEEHPNAV